MELLTEYHRTRLAEVKSLEERLEETVELGVRATLERMLEEAKRAVFGAEELYSYAGFHAY
jgi:hypothetical protein